MELRNGRARALAVGIGVGLDGEATAGEPTESGQAAPAEGHQDGGAAGRRLPPMPESAWSPEVREMLRGTQGRVASLEGSGQRKPDEVLAILRTMAYHPRIMKPFLGFATAIAQQGALSRRDSELLALRASWNCGSDFEWGHHVKYAQVAGLTDAEIARIAVGPDAPGWSAEDRDLLRLADQLHARQQIDAALWRRLDARFDEAQLVELPFVVGQYTMLSMVANMTGVALESGHDPLPAGPR
ncbi:MAG: carboxymuconolactone decarboxylase family protein [Deltaproteobacteria bacterium]|nr:carboxymuconolactone decarboxylase family protein [Deltaproteobacteria bacterium]